MHHSSSVRKVGFRDDTSYLAAHYGGGITRQPARATTNKIPSSRGATSVRTLDITAQQSTASASNAPTSSPIVPNRKRSNGNAGKGGAVQAGARKIGETAALVRPTLSEQLASIGKAAEDITA